MSLCHLGFVAAHNLVQFLAQLDILVVAWRTRLLAIWLLFVFCPAYFRFAVFSGSCLALRSVISLRQRELISLLLWVLSVVVYLPFLLVSLKGCVLWLCLFLDTFLALFILEPGHRISVRPLKTQNSVWPESSQVSYFVVWQGPKASSGAQRRLWSACAEAQADLSLRWAHMQSCRKCCFPAHCLKQICNNGSFLMLRIIWNGFNFYTISSNLWLITNMCHAAW